MILLDITRFVRDDLNTTYLGACYAAWIFMFLSFFAIPTDGLRLLVALCLSALTFLTFAATCEVFGL